MESVLKSNAYLEGSKKAQRDLIGKVIYSYILKLATAYSAPKITGMLLGMDPSVFEITVSDFELFKTKVFEA